jgi:predicted DCC family thiol-disulfide oxidoreductase YuxK
VISLALAAAGLFTRPSTLVAFAGGLYLLGLPHSFGQTYHFDALVVFILLILAAARSGDACSVDALVRAVREPASHADPPPPSGDYRWPVRLTWVMMALIFFAAGASKLRHSGWEWIASDTMAIVLTRAYYHVSDADPIVPFGLWLAASPTLSRALAAATIAIEVGVPLALVSSTARAVLVPSAALMLLGIRVLMGPTFGVFLLCNLFWVPWERLGRLLRVALRLRRRAVLYDGACGLCRPTVNVIRRLDILHNVDALDCVHEWSRIESRFSALDRTEALTRMHVVDASGRVTTGFDAYRSLARAMPLGWLVLPLLYVPGARWAGTRLYEAIASRRPRQACAVSTMPGMAQHARIE